MNENSFDDHYEDLQVSANADQETSERVYRLLAKRYHPDNNDSGSVEKFDIITKAYKVLGQAEKRAAYDATYAEKKDLVLKALAQTSAPGGFAADSHIRRQILSVLYIERRQDPEKAGVGVVAHRATAGLARENAGIPHLVSEGEEVYRADRYRRLCHHGSRGR